MNLVSDKNGACDDRGPNSGLGLVYGWMIQSARVDSRKGESREVKRSTGISVQS